MRTRWIPILVLAAVVAGPAMAQMPDDSQEDFYERPPREEIEEFDFIGYFLTRHENSNTAATNTFLSGQVVGRLFGGNTTRTTSATSRYTEQRFLPMITYSPRLFDGWAKMRMSFEFDWTYGDAAYGAAANSGGGFAGDTVNMQTQNLFMEFRPRKNLFVNMGLQRLYDNVGVPWYTFTDHLLQKGYRLALFGSDATGVSTHWFFAPDQRIKLGAYQLWENQIQERDDVVLFEANYERDYSITGSIGASVHYLNDRASGEGGPTGLGTGINSTLADFNGVARFELGNVPQKTDVYWLGTHFHDDPLLQQRNFGWSGFAWYNGGKVQVPGSDISIGGVAANLRLAARWGAQKRDQIVLDSVFTTGDDDSYTDGTYSGVLTANNWTSPGAVFIGHPLYLLLPHGTVVNRYTAAVIDIQNVGYGLQASALAVSKELVPNKWLLKAAVGHGRSSVEPTNGGSTIGTEINASLRWNMRVFLEAELHAAYLFLGDFYDSAEVNGGLVGERPDDPWTVFASIKWIMF